MLELEPLAVVINGDLLRSNGYSSSNRYHSNQQLAMTVVLCYKMRGLRVALVSQTILLFSGCLRIKARIEVVRAVAMATQSALEATLKGSSLNLEDFSWLSNSAQASALKW